MSTNALASIACPMCKSRPVETTATVAWIRGFLIAYRFSRRTLIGCVPCVRRELLAEAGKSALLGWFSISAIIANPFLIIYNLIRGATLQPNEAAVLKKLQELGIALPQGQSRT